MTKDAKTNTVTNTEPVINSSKKFNTFIFDLDGTLLNTLPDLVLLTNSILQEQGYPLRSEAEILSFVGSGVRRLMYLALPEGTSEEATDAAMDLWNERFHDYYHNTHPYPGVVDMLQQLRARGCKIGVISNKLQAGVDLILDVCLPGLVDVAFGEGGQDSQGRVMLRKPDPIGFFMTLDELDALPKDTLYAGDSPGDILTAHKADVFAVAVDWGYHEKADFYNAEPEAVPDLYITSPLELLNFAEVS